MVKFGNRILNALMQRPTIGKSTRAGEFQQWQKFTEVMVYYIIHTENQS
jgi:hypothetical protein